ncbi:tetratricopeptide repeat protein [bacterium]|nr:tetratricopeptide repeat protein [bacterium]
MISLRTPVVSKYNSYIPAHRGIGQSFCGADISDLLSKGDKAINENRAEDALSAYADACKRNPDEIVVYKKLGRAYSHLKDYENAEKNYQIYADNNPKDEEAWTDLGEAQMKRGYYDKAMKSFQQAVDLNPQNDLACRSLKEAKNGLKAIFSPEAARIEKETQATKNLREALEMTTEFLTPAYMRDLADVQIIFGETATMGGTSNIAQYENNKKTITVSNSYKYAAPQVIAAYLVHESTHAHDKDGYTSVYEEQDAYNVQTRFWQKYSNNVQDPEMDYALDLYKKSPEVLRNRVEEIYKLRDPNIAMTSPNHPPEKKSHFWHRKTTAASQGIKEYNIIA